MTSSRPTEPGAEPILYADTSAIARACFADERGHVELQELLLTGIREVMTSALGMLELTRAGYAKQRLGHRIDVDAIVARCERALAVVDIETRPHLSDSRALVARHSVRTLDAIHLAVALDLRARGVADLVFVTRDRAQARAAEAEGLAVE